MDKIKVRISVEGLGDQTVYLPFESGVEIYAAASNHTVDKIKEVFLSKNDDTCDRNFVGVIDKEYEGPVTSCRPSSSQIKILKSEEGPEKIDDRPVMGCRVPGVNMPAREGTTQVESTDFLPNSKPIESKTGEEIMKEIESEESDNPFTHEMFGKSRLVMLKCPDCGKITARRMTLKESNKTHCHFCKKDYEVKRVTNTVSQCPCCGDSFVCLMADGLQELICRICEAPIDLVPVKDGRKLMSANIAK